MVDQRTEASCTVTMNSSKSMPGPRIMERSSFHDLTAHDAKDVSFNYLECRLNVLQFLSVLITLYYC
jgi:hypothetical protein